MMRRNQFEWRLALTIAALGLAVALPAAAGKVARKGEVVVKKIAKSDAEWEALLKPEQYRVLRKEGTELAFTGAYWNHDAAGVYRCAACGLELFRSGEKFDSGTGWPSFWAPAVRRHVAENSDLSLGMPRIEVECARCGGHLGHLFDDGPEPTGLRYCINSAALTFEAAKKK